MKQSKLADYSTYFDKAEDDAPCRCKAIVLNAYNNLVNSGVSSRDALKISSNVLAYHHPCPAFDARTIVECWLHDACKGRVH